MIVDLFILAALISFGIMGQATGAVRQLTHWSGVAVGYLAAWPLALKLTPAVAPKLSIAPIGVKISLAAVLYLVLYVVGAFVIQRVLNRWLGKLEGSPADASAGIALGVLKGTIFLYVGLSVAVFYEDPLVKTVEAEGPPARSSVCLAFIRHHNLFTEPPLLSLQKTAGELRKKGRSSPRPVVRH